MTAKQLSFPAKGLFWSKRTCLAGLLISLFYAGLVCSGCTTTEELLRERGAIELNRIGIFLPPIANSFDDSLDIENIIAHVPVQEVVRQLETKYDITVDTGMFQDNERVRENIRQDPDSTYWGVSFPMNGDMRLTFIYTIRARDKIFRAQADLVMFTMGREKVLVSEIIKLDWAIIGDYITYDEEIAKNNRILNRLNYDIVENPDDVSLYIKRIKAYAALGRYNDALDDANMILALEPSAENYMRRGRVYFDASLSRDANRDALLHHALQDMTRAIEMVPGVRYFYYNRAFIYLYLHDYEQVVINTTKAIELDTKKANAYGLRGLAYIQLSQFQKALEDTDVAVMIDPNRAEFFEWRGWAYGALENNEQALNDLTTAITINPDLSHSYILRGTIYCKMGKYQEALNDLSIYIKQEPTGEAYTVMYMIYQGMADQETDDEKRIEYLRKSAEHLMTAKQKKENGEHPPALEIRD
jgi:tetratricopeptide (TPR) repeat protein